MPTLLQISQLGHPVLREIAAPVEHIDNLFIQSLIDNMIYTCQEADAVGIAAPQVYQSLRLFIIASTPSERYPNAPDMAPTAIINPEIIGGSEEKELDWEGCLSVPGIRGKVYRRKWIKVSYFNRNGKKEEHIFEDFLARVFQHEYDHINGVFFLDKADSASLISEKEYQKMIKERSRKK